MGLKSHRFASSGRIYFLNFFLIHFVYLFPHSTFAQGYRQIFIGTVVDQESHQPLSGASVECETSLPAIRCMTDSLGRFKLQVPFGRHSFSFSHLGYMPKQITDIHFGTGKEVFLQVELTEMFYQIEGIELKSSGNRWINPMATVSTRTLRVQDAARYAAGYFDASRMVTNFAGVTSGISDESNEIVIRGNSPRGLLWRLEGIEIPNPNHFPALSGSSGGCYSAISTNVLSSFDFFTGSFPAEYGNASSGVMDLNLRTGNTETHEFSFALGMLGADASTEGALNRKKGHSYLSNYRFADYQYLTRIGMVDAKDNERLPRISDYAFKASFKTKERGTFDVFAVGGSSEACDIAYPDIQELKKADYQEEFMERQTIAIAGVKHTLLFPNDKTHIRSTAAFTYQFSSDRTREPDPLQNNTVTYYDRFEYPSLRFASLTDHKFNTRHSLRMGITFNQVWGKMYATQLNPQMQFDTLINDTGSSWYGSSFAQWNYKPGDVLEINTGLHVFHSGITHELMLEPRWGMIVRLPGQQSVNFGLGFHSRLESLSVYYMIPKSLSEERNHDLKTTKAFHLTVGYTRNLSKNLQFAMEAYTQHLWAVPMDINSASQISLINSLGEIPFVIMDNSGKAKNNGFEFTLEKSFSRNYYYLATASLYNSKYLAPDGFWYNTYFNTNYIYNLLGGKEFQTGKYQQNTFGINLRGILRGGFRYTPVDQVASAKNDELVYKTASTYGKRLPGFGRIDCGVSYRINNKGKSLIFLFDVQDILDAENILRRKFEYWNNQIVPFDSRSIGMLEVLTIKAKF